MSPKPWFAIGPDLIITTIAITLLVQSVATRACTTFASVGAANANNGLIIAKNRDSTMPGFVGLEGQPVDSQQRYTYSATEL